MNYNIYIKKNVDEHDSSNFYIGFKLLDSILMLEICDFDLKISKIHYETLKENYITLDEFVESSEYIGLKDKKTNYMILYRRKNISIVNNNSNIELDYDYDYILDNKDMPDYYDIDEIKYNIMTNVSEILKSSYLSVIADIINFFDKSMTLERELKKVMSKTKTKEDYYKELFDLPNEFDNETLKKNAFSYLKYLTENIRNKKMKEKMINDSLDAYNYLTKKLSKKI